MQHIENEVMNTAFASKQCSWAGSSRTALCAVHISPMAALKELPTAQALGHGKQLITCFLQEGVTPEAGTRLGARAQPSLCEGPLRSAAGKVTASKLGSKIKMHGFSRKSPPLLENFYGWTEVEHLQGRREQRSSEEP